jgi:glycine/D-amino acid oxidase-like deaminating enzyme
MCEAARLLPILKDCKIEGQRVEVRPISPDDLPILGPTDTVQNLFHAVTHGGVTLCLGVARLLGDMITTGHEPDGLCLYRLDRDGRFE